MHPEKYKAIGSCISVVSAAVLTWMLSEGMLELAINKTTQVKGDYWTWWYLLLPLVFVGLGINYLRIGIKETGSSRWVSKAAIVHLVALALGTFGLVYPYATKLEFGYIVTLALGLPTIVLAAIGVIFLAKGSTTRPLQNPRP